jgi:hypothetical protein
LLVDFDTTVNSSPTDISGQGNHGRFLNGASYSAANKAFSFDGSNDTISAPIVIAGGNMVFSESIWFKIDAFPSTSTNTAVLSFFGNAGGNTGFITGYEHNRMQHDLYGMGVVAATTFVVNQWYHVVVIYHGNTSSDPNVRSSIYINGVKQTLTAVSLTTATQNLPTSTEYQLARYINSGNIRHNGLISNPKLYSVVLEPSEVQKLYRLGRTGRSMVISDTAVGIGKVPEAQLDVRGVAQFGSIYAPGTIIQVKHNGGTSGLTYSSAGSAGTSGDMSITYATGFKLSITPRSTKSQIYVNMNVLAYFASQGTGTNGVRAQVFRKVGTTYTRVYGRGGSAHDLNRYGTPVENLHTYLHISFVDSAPNTLETVEYELRAALYNTTGTLQIGNNSNQPATITLMEIGGE